MSQAYDIAVIGGGPGGYAAALRAAGRGARVVLFEEEDLGGCCLNVGCIPTKALLEKAALIEKIRRDLDTGVLRDAGLYSWKKVQERKDTAVRQLTAGVGSLLGAAGVGVVRARAALSASGVISAGGETYHAEKTIIATGSAPMIPPIPGAGGKNVLTSTGALSLARVPESLVIVGAGVIGLELASIYRAFGARVSVLEMQSDLLPAEDRETAAFLKARLREKGIQFVFSARVLDIADAPTGKRVRYQKDGAEGAAEGEYVLLAAGRAPRTAGVAESGVALDRRGYIIVNDRMETSLPGVLAVGDVTGGMQLAHAAYHQAELAVRAAFGDAFEPKPAPIPRCIYSLPQMASVGLSEEAAREQYADVAVSSFPYGANGKAVASEETAGFVKAVADRASGRLLGVHIAGYLATELISGAVVAVGTGVTVDAFQELVFPHPTLGEMLGEAALGAAGLALHIHPKK